MEKQELQKNITTIITKSFIENSYPCSNKGVSISTKNLYDILNQLSLDTSITNIVDIDCIQTPENNPAISSQIEIGVTDMIKNTLTSQNLGINTNLSQDLLNSIKNIVTKIVINDIKVCVINSIFDKEISVKKISDKVLSLNFDQTNNSIYNCLQTNQDFLNNLDDIFNKFKIDNQWTFLGFLKSWGLSLGIGLFVFLAILFFRRRNNYYPPYYYRPY